MTTATPAAFTWLVDLVAELGTPAVQNRLVSEQARRGLALALLDCIVREVLPLGLQAQGFAAEALELRTIDSLVTSSPTPALAVSLRALHARVAAEGMHFHQALGSAARGVEDLSRSLVSDAIGTSGPLEMSLRRALAAGASEAEVRALLQEVVVRWLA